MGDTTPDKNDSVRDWVEWRWRIEKAESGTAARYDTLKFLKSSKWMQIIPQQVAGGETKDRAD
ncbi:CLUMA_CG006188, isoform A [Clunio marinus]|uniref:CLUMA_CG006188, isoform A n=1 Tax=Clunio marinus TaxID=568069 RepID=A0A1J1I2L3_9DIPT|nr:CLUMA_CG006188, isoform A [Clunio marinus]